MFFFYTQQQAKAEQEEEFISNTLLKKIQSLKKEKETLAMNYEQEEEFLTNDLSRKLMQVHVFMKKTNIINYFFIWHSILACEKQFIQWKFV